MGLEWTQTAIVGKGGSVEVIVPLLEEGVTVEVVVRGNPTTHAKRRFGSAKGQGFLAHDFDDPFEEFAEYR